MIRKWAFLCFLTVLFAACSHRGARLPIIQAPPDTNIVAPQPTAIPSPPEEAEMIPLKYCWVKSEYINLRTEPDKDAGIVKALPRGTKLRLLEDLDRHDGADGDGIHEWFKVELAGNTQVMGYVRSTLISFEKPIDPLEDFRSRFSRTVIPGESIPSLITGMAQGENPKSLYIYVTGDWKNILNAYTVFPVSHPDRQTMQEDCVKRLENIAGQIYRLWDQSLERNGYGPANDIKFIDEAGVTVGEVSSGPGNDPRIIIKH